MVKHKRAHYAYFIFFPSSLPSISMSQSISLLVITSKCKKKEMLRVELMPSGDYKITCTLNWICVDHVSQSPKNCRIDGIHGYKWHLAAKPYNCMALKVFRFCVFSTWLQGEKVSLSIAYRWALISKIKVKLFFVLRI